MGRRLDRRPAADPGDALTHLLTLELLLGIIFVFGIFSVLFEVVTAPFALLVDVFSFLSSAVALRRMKVEEKPQDSDAPKETRAQQIRQGLAYVWRNPLLRTITISSALYNFFTKLIVSNVVGVTLRQAVTEDNMLGRMTATYKFVSYGAMSLGALAAGIAGELLGLRTGLIVAGIALVTTVLVALTPALRHIRELPTEPTPVEPEAAKEPVSAAKA